MVDEPSIRMGQNSGNHVAWIAHDIPLFELDRDGGLHDGDLPGKTMILISNYHQYGPQNHVQFRLF